MIDKKRRNPHTQKVIGVVIIVLLLLVAVYFTSGKKVEKEEQKHHHHGKRGKINAKALRKKEENLEKEGTQPY